MLLMFCALESVSVEVHVNLRGSTGALSGGVLPGPLRGKLSRGHLLYGVNKDTKMEAKHKNGGLGAAKSCPIRSSFVFECWGEVLG